MRPESKDKIIELLSNRVDQLESERKAIIPALRFAYKVSQAMKELRSSHVYFTMQQAYEGENNDYGDGEMPWDACESIWDEIIRTYESQQALRNAGTNTEE